MYYAILGAFGSSKGWFCVLRARKALFCVLLHGFIMPFWLLADGWFCEKLFSVISELKKSQDNCSSVFMRSQQTFWFVRIRSQSFTLYQNARLSLFCFNVFSADVLICENLFSLLSHLAECKIMMFWFVRICSQSFTRTQDYCSSRSQHYKAFMYLNKKLSLGFFMAYSSHQVMVQI